MTYRERLGVPWSWWAIGLFFALSFVTAVGFYAGPGWAGLAALVTTVAVAAALLGYGWTLVVVDADGLRAGRSVLEWAYLGEVKALSAAETSHRLAAGADHAAWLHLRPYLRRAVEVEVADPADPHPYWLVSTRRPEELAAALASGRPISPDEATPARG